MFDNAAATHCPFVRKPIVHAVVMTRALFAILMALWIPGASADSFEFAGIKRNYTLFAPTTANASPAPLIVLLHGSYGSAAALVRLWSSLAEHEGIVLVAPDAREREAWQVREDGPQFIRAVIDEAAAKHWIDRRRIYLFGNSGGAVYSLILSMIESQVFAATAIHAGAWRAPNEFRAVKYAKRKIPIAIFIGDKDEYFPLFTARKTQSALEEAGHPVSVTVIPGHTHSYPDVALEVNRDAWQFMKANRL
ncbi:MAG TPA: PHB depolymerase family esterase [Steroidobacteraceae bacterium]|nr:PHB depolymerase family esterase [Steroidobacteraceae bacterium]